MHADVADMGLVCHWRLISTCHLRFTYSKRCAYSHPAIAVDYAITIIRSESQHRLSLEKLLRLTRRVNQALLQVNNIPPSDQTQPWLRQTDKGYMNYGL